MLLHLCENIIYHCWDVYLTFKSAAMSCRFSLDPPYWHYCFIFFSFMCLQSRGKCHQIDMIPASLRHAIKWVENETLFFHINAKYSMLHQPLHHLTVKPEMLWTWPGRACCLFAIIFTTMWMWVFDNWLCSCFNECHLAAVCVALETPHGAGLLNTNWVDRSSTSNNFIPYPTVTWSGNYLTLTLDRDTKHAWWSITITQIQDFNSQFRCGVIWGLANMVWFCVNRNTCFILTMNWTWMGRSIICIQNRITVFLPLMLYDINLDSLLLLRSITLLIDFW